MMHDQNNVFYAVALSIVILITWQYFFATSFLGKPAAPKAAQPGVIVSGTAIMRPQTQAVATPAETIASAQPQSHDKPHLPGRNVSPSIRPGLEDQSR
jgi:hypothetical protein